MGGERGKAMAKLSAHGKELLRIEQELPASDLTTWIRVTRTYHADGKILQKHDCRFNPSQYEPHPGIYSYGWKLYAKLKKEVDPATHVAKQVALIQSGQSKWKIVTGGLAPVIISQARIMRAIESGESIGFCKECGHSQDGCEPDARGYKCESCGAMEVYGAEEMLIGS
jgi:hypothetical protein